MFGPGQGSTEICRVLDVSGEVDDAQTMASNILDVLAQGAGIMGHRARGHVEAEFLWDRTMSLLFGEVLSKPSQEHNTE